MDIGPDSLKKFEAILKNAKTILWNGPMGKFEDIRFAEGSKKLAEIIANCTKAGAVSIIGGGETAQLVYSVKGAAEAMTHISTGGGAALELLEGKPMPGIADLTTKTP